MMKGSIHVVICLFGGLLYVIGYAVAVPRGVTTHYCYRTSSYRERYREKWCLHELSNGLCCYLYRWSWRTVTYTHKECCPGWGSCYCHVPKCKNCGTNGVCIAPDKCYCRNGGTSGTSNCGSPSFCSAEKNCYPGTCDESGSVCNCASGFAGSNCNQITDVANVTHNDVRLVRVINGQLVTVFQGSGGDPLYDFYTYWTRWRDFSEMVFNWELKYMLPVDKPHPPDDLKELNVGAVKTWAQMEVESKDGTVIIGPVSIPCASPVISPSNPRSLVQCKDVKYDFKSGIPHLAKMKLTVHSKTGGYKVVNNKQTFKETRQTFTGTEFSQPLHIIFDIYPPKHCDEDKSCVPDDMGFPIWTTPDIARGETNIFWSSWHDNDSGIGDFFYSVHSMAPNQDGLLEEQTPPVHNGTWWGNVPLWYTPPSPGTYSIVITVGDAVGNVRKARKLFIYDNSSSVEAVSEQKLYVKNAGENTNYRWISSSQTDRGKGEDLDVDWTGHFINKDHVRTSMLGQVAFFKSGNDDPEHEWIDMSDRKEDNNRTRDEIENLNGITNFEIFHVVNPPAIDDEPYEDQWTSLGQVNSTMLQVPRKDGDQIRIWVRASDFMGNQLIEHTTVNVDGSGPVYVENKSTVSKNVKGENARPIFSSTCDLQIQDLQSGIDEIHFEVYEIYNQTTLIKIENAQGVEVGQKYFQKSKRRKRQATPDDDCRLSNECYCLTKEVGEEWNCFYYVQKLYIDNCWFMDREAKDFLVKFTAYNGAREETEGKLDIGKLEDLEGRGQYPPIPLESLKFVSDSTGGSYDKTLQWEHPKACSKIKSVILEYRDHQGSMKELNEHGKIRKITELKPGTEYTVNLYVEYATGNTPRRSEAVSISFNTTCNCDGCCMEVITPLLSVGAIIGIVCGGLVLLLVIAIVIVVIVRKSRHQPAVPPTIQHAGHNVRKRVSTWFGAGHGADNWDVPPPYDHNNPEAGTIENLAFSPAEAMQASGIAYAEMSEDDDMYIYGDMKTDEKARWKFSNDRIEFGKAIPNAKGNFAVIRFATLMTKKGKETIVAKSLKAHHTDDDERLMRAKMNFMGTKLRLHANIVNFIGALPEADGGPVMLLEYCDEGRLSDWLKKHQHIDGDVEENLSNFSMMIANGLMFLHENDILHKRLGIRNIYLKNKNGSLHAKLAGFGPMRGEAEGSEAKEKIPIKWMAPEQMDKVPGQKRIYSKETDVWSYGIVLWELYSKGEQPYPNIKAKDLKEQVKSGYRMPKPNDCPDHLYTEIIQECWYEKPGVRPPIEQIYTSLREYYDSAGRQSTYYDEDDLMEEEDLYYADGFSTMSYDKTNKDFYE